MAGTIQNTIDLKVTSSSRASFTNMTASLAVAHPRKVCTLVDVMVTVGRGEKGGREFESCPGTGYAGTSGLRNGVPCFRDILLFAAIATHWEAPEDAVASITT